MNLAWTIKYVVQTGRARIVPFELFFRLTGLRATKSSINGRVFGVIAIITTLVFVASGLGAGISSIWWARIAYYAVATSQPAIFAHAKAGHECREGCHGLRLLLVEVSG